MKLLILPTLTLLAGCAADAIRPTAAGTASLTQNLKTELTSFAARQNAEMEARRASVAILDENSSLSAFEARKHLMDWRASDNKAALRIYEQATSTHPPTLPAGALIASPLTVQSTARGVQPDVKDYDAVLTALKPLAGRRSAADQVGFVLSYGRALTERMRENVAKAAEADGSADRPNSVETGAN